MRYYITGSVADGEYISPYLDSYHKDFKAYIRFFSDPKMQNQVTATGGTVSFKLSPDDYNYYDFGDGTFNATDAYSDAVPNPSALGLAIRSKVILSGVTGAAYFKVTIWGV